MLFSDTTYPTTRMRRMRSQAFSRALLRETTLSPAKLIQPLFVIEGENKAEPVPSMPGVSRLTLDKLITEAKQIEALGISAIMLFPVLGVHAKSLDAKAAYDDNGLVQQAIRAIKDACPHLGVSADVALDPYTSHGQDGLLDQHNYVTNDATVAVLVKQALSHARAGVDIIVPSDMMDGRIGKIRQALEAENFVNTMILAHSTKYASSFYGPFRDAVNSKDALKGADKYSYQMDPANVQEGLHETMLDIKEGADMLMVKPAMPFLDVLYRVKDTFKKPTLTYQVSGEYAMLKAASMQSWIDEKACVLESLTAMHRAGADAIVTYYAKDVAKWLSE